jgi:hypothetical protein
VPVPDCAVASQGLPGTCSLGREQFRDLASCARLSPEPGGRDLARVALANLPMTRPMTVRTHQGLCKLSDLFSNLVCELGTPLRNRTVDLLLTMHAGFVWQCRIQSGYRSSEEYRRPGKSYYVCGYLDPLSSLKERVGVRVGLACGFAVFWLLRA